ncbi:GDSL-type esterase/lipase family protein [Phaeobacter sp. CAU 1743]|uniref:GDSL-type esterase/lipase family protein n=1 Tax=Phaeobacter sp. CAU 1743 TaxID=3140367 RepID=UPI00325BB06F
MTYPHGGAGQIWRDGSPTAHNPEKSEIRDWGLDVEGRIVAIEAAVTGTARYTRDTLADVNAIASPATGDTAYVLDDPGNTGTYEYGGASWSRVADLPASLTDLGILREELDGKSDVGHVHPISDVTGLQGALDGKSADGHGHAIGDVTGLQGALDGKSADGHGHAIGDVTGLQGALDSGLNLKGRILAGESLGDFRAPGAYSVQTGAVDLPAGAPDGGFLINVEFEDTFVRQTYFSYATDYRPWIRTVRLSNGYIGPWVSLHDTLQANIDDGLNGHFVAFQDSPVLDVEAGVIRYGAGYFRRKDGGVNILFDPQDIGSSSYDVPISGVVSGAVMHYLDTSVDPALQNPIVALSGGNVIGTGSSLIPLGIWYENRWTPIMGGQLHDIRTPNVDYATWFVLRPIVVDLDDTLGNGSPTVYVPRNLWISYAGTTSGSVTAANALSDRLPGNYCAISVTKSALADGGSGQTLYWDFADQTVKRAVHPDAPVTAGTNGYLLLLTLTGSPEGVFTSPNGLPVVELTPKTHVDVLADVRASLFSKLRSAHVTLIGDSITWGLTASDNGPSQPRSHALTDTRDDVTSSSWANKFRRWAASVATGLRGETLPAPGESLHTHNVECAPYSDSAFSVLDLSRKVLVKNGQQNRDGPLLKSHLDVQAGIGNRCAFEFVGTGFTVFYATQGGDTWTIEVDGVVVATIPATGNYVWQNQAVVSGLSFGQHGVEIINQSTAKVIRLEAVRFEKSLRFSNNGLIGTNSEEWLPAGALLDGGVPEETTHLFVQLGTNDRAQAPEATLPAGELRTSINLRQIVEWLKANRQNVHVILMAPPMATNDEQGDAVTFNASTDDLAREIAQLADEMGCGFIDNYTCTNLEFVDGVSFLADGLHPNDSGHTVIARNIISAITNA